MSDETRTPQDLALETEVDTEVEAEESTDESLQNLFTLGIMAAVAISFLAVCLPLFLL